MSSAPRNFKFVTISAHDWRRSLRIARARGNEALAVITAAAGMPLVAAANPAFVPAVAGQRKS